jgi:ATP-dependent Zn protease
MMQEILLVAKGLALREQQSKVRREEFFQALHFFTIEGRAPVVRKILAEQQEVIGGEHEVADMAPLLPELMDNARRSVPFPLADDLQALIRQLFMNSVTLTMKPLPGEPELVMPPLLSEVASVRRSLEAGLIGQERAIKDMTRYLALRGQEKTTGVRGLFVLAGPPASGKSLTASLLAKGLGTEYAVWSYDCSNLSSIHERSVLDGSPTNISGAQPGELTDFVRRHPKSVVVLEHFDRMHAGVQSFLMPLLESGFLKDMYGFFEQFDCKNTSNSKQIADSEVDFRNVYLVLTVEAGAELYDAPTLVERLRADGGDAQVSSALINALATARNELSQPPGLCFSPPVLSRLVADGAIVLLQPLGWQALLRICRDGVTAARNQLRIITNHKLQVHILPAMLDSLAPLLVLAEGGQADPRRLGCDRLLDSLFGTLCDRWFTGIPVADRIEVRLSDADRAVVAAMVADLEADPVRTLFRTRQRLLFDTVLENADHDGDILWCRNPRLVKECVAMDYQGSDALLVDVPGITLDYVAGHDAVKAKLRRQVALMRDSRSLAAQGIRPPGGCLFHGSPGTGKTTLARAFAGEAKLPFVAVNGPDLISLEFQRKIFAKLRRYAPAVLFVDELDAIGTRSGKGLDPAINTLLAEIDGFSSRVGEPIFVVGATNLRHKIDPALLRPGRLELSFEVSAPDRSARRFLLERIAGRLVGGSVGESLIDYSSGMSGAQIEAACREMILLPCPLEEQQARMVLEEVVFGEHAVLSEELRQAISFHEAGHAVAMVRGEIVRVDYVSLTAREGNAGHVWSSSSSPGNLTATKARAMIASILAGRVAQCLYGGDSDRGTDSGDMSDLQKATRLAYHAVGYLGLDPVIGSVALPKQESGFTMPELARQVEERVRIWLSEAEQAARQLLQKHWPEVEAVAAELLSQGALAHDRLLAVMDGAGRNPLKSEKETTMTGR